MTSASPRTTIVVPCYNEAARLDEGAFASLLQAEAGVTLLFVNDGSHDDTLGKLHGFRGRSPGQVAVLDLGQNHGKAEAVRRGLTTALQTTSDIVGYLDADLATPISEVRRLLEIMHGRPDAQVLIGARVALLGRQIQRSPGRHYLGRLFASAASLTLGLPVYDTQCGAKFFRRSPALAQALAEPFLSRWVFDVELLGRLLAGSATTAPLAAAAIVEEPLRMWIDVPGSKLRAKHMIGAALNLVRIGQDLRRRRGQARSVAP